MQIKPHEKRIIGQWRLSRGELVADDECDRIETLVDNYLDHVCDDKTGWDKLYIDPTTNQYWERVYLQSEMHGGGPPSLICLTREAAQLKYNV